MNNKVLLTGVSGWIAKHTAIELLNAGYEVLGTVRNNTLIEQTKETISQHASIDKLSFVELDLLKDDGWNEAAYGCKYIMHLASPFPFKVSNNRNIVGKHRSEQKKIICYKFTFFVKFQLFFLQS